MTRQTRSLARMQALVEEQAALRRVATLVAVDPDPSHVFARVCEEVGTVLGVESTNLARFESPGKARVVGGWGVDSAPVFPVGAEITLSGHTAVQKVSRSGRPERVDDYADVEGELAERLRQVGIASAVAAPITVAGRLWGAVVASSGQAFAFPSDSEERIGGFAELVADALASADAREQLAASRARIVEAADSARRRLERNLHDGAQQRLVALALQLREVEVKLHSDPETAGRLLASAREALALALDELRELARGIHPAVLSDRGLGPALEALAARTPVPVRISGIPEARLSPQVEAAAYYLVAEALTNVVKHAGATSVAVEIARTHGHTRVEVRDDGTGGAAVGEGTGLRGLADRVEALGGSLDVHSRNGAGTSVVGRIPVG